MTDKEKGKYVLDHLARHLVCWHIYYRWVDGSPDDLEHQMAISCFVIELEGEWYLITAGHVFRNEPDRDGLFDLLDDNRITIENSSLLDGFGINGRSYGATPFPIDTLKTFMNKEELGLDIAIVHLSDLFREGLKVSGVVPLNELNWQTGYNKEFAFYLMLGFPATLFEQDNPPAPVGSRTSRTLKPALLQIEKLPDDKIPDFARGSEDGFPWFVGTWDSNFPTLRGMSGGPIFGGIGTPDGGMAYWVIAVQSSQFVTSRILKGCLLATFIELLKRMALRHSIEP